MKIQTSNYRKSGKEKNAIAISRGVPEFFSGETYEKLFPTWDMVKNTKGLTDEEWEKEYRERILSKLDPVQTAKELDGKILLCWEGEGKACHRHYVAKWLKEIGVDVSEVEVATRKKKKETVDFIEVNGLLF